MNAVATATITNQRPLAIVFRPDHFYWLAEKNRNQTVVCTAATKFMGIPAHEKQGQRESYRIFYDQAELEHYLQN